MSAAPLGNANALRTGRNVSRRTFTVPRLGPKGKATDSQTMLLRRRLERIVIRERGRLTTSDEDTINRAARSEALALMLARRLAELEDHLPWGEYVTVLDSISRFTKDRSECIARLGLKKVDGTGHEVSPWSQFDAGRLQAAGDGLADPANADAAGATLEPKEGAQ